MKVVLAGAYGHLGSDVFRALLNAGHEVVATDVVEKDLGLTGNYTFCLRWRWALTAAQRAS